MNRVSHPFFRIFDSLRDYGFSETFFRLLHRLRIISVLHTFEFIFKEISLSTQASLQSYAESNGKSIALREIYEFELNSFSYTKGMYPVDTLRMHFSKGMRFFAALNDNEIIAVNGIHPTRADLVYVGMPNVRLPGKIAYFNCALTSPAYRNCLIGTKLCQYLMDTIQREGFKGIFGAVFIENRAGVRWNSRNGFQYWGRISYIKCGKKEFWIKRFSKVGRRYTYILNGVRTKEKVLEEVLS